jgi:fucose 4-O-acetylase-like acetyltransferase
LLDQRALLDQRILLDQRSWFCQTIWLGPVGVGTKGAMSDDRITRDPWLDNAKMALVTLVVIGHAWAMLPADGVVGHLYDFLYAWHMPAFVLVTGYLSRSFDYAPERLWQLVRTVAVPYVIFECLMAFFREWFNGERLEDLFADPHWPLWFLTALICWRLVTPVFRRLPLVAAVTLAVGVSVASGLVTGETSEYFDLTRTAGMLPFFVLGIHLTPARLERLRGVPARWCAAGTFAAVWLLTAHIDQLADTHWLYYSTPYADLGVTDARGALTRLAVLAVGLVGAAAFLAVVPRVDGWFARMGAATLVVYLCHGFVIRGLEYAGYVDWAAQHPLLAPPVTFLGALLLALGLASPPAVRRLRILVDPFGRAEEQVEQAVELNVVAQETGSLPAMRNDMAGRR